MSRRQKWLLGLILAIGCLLRLTYLLESLRAPDFAAPRFEAQYHDYWARALLSKDWTPPPTITDPEIQTRPYFRPPGYPFFLAAIYRGLGASYLWPKLVQSALGLISCLLLFNIMRRYFGPVEALGSTALMATYWLFFFFEGELMAPVLLIFLLLLALQQIVRWSEELTLRRAAAAGILLGLATIVRPNVLVLPAASLLWIFWHRYRLESLNLLEKKENLWKRLPLTQTLVFCGALGLAILPVTLRNYVVAGEPVLVTSNGGINLFIGTHPDNDGTTPGVRELGQLAGLRGWDSFDYPKIAEAVEVAEGRPMTDAEVSVYFTRRAVQQTLENPGRALQQTWRKVLLFWGPAEVSNNKVLAAEREASPTLGSGIDFATLFAFALFGLGRVIIRWRSHQGAAFDQSLAIAALFFIWTVAYCASYLPFFVAARFRVGLVPWMAAFGGVGIAFLWRSRHNVRLLAFGLLTVAALRLLVGTPWVPYEDDFGLWHYRRGLLYQSQDRLPEAIAEFQAACQRNPKNLDGLLALAGASEESGQREEAIEAYETALKLEPGSLIAHNNLALLFARSNRLSEAIPHWESALEIEPERLSLLNNLAIALATGPPEIRDPDRAVDLAQKANELSLTTDPQLLSTLDLALHAAEQDNAAESTE